MARTISTTSIAPGLTQTVERRTARVCITVTPAGRALLVAEQQDVTRVNGKQIGGPVDAPSIVIDHDRLVANPSFAATQAVIASAIDREASRLEAEAAKVIADAQAAADKAADEAEPIVVPDAEG